MNLQSVTPEVGSDLTLDEHIALVLDLSRRVDLLDDLLRAARLRRLATDCGCSLLEPQYGEPDAALAG